MHISGATHICNQNQIEVRMAINLEPNPTPSDAGYPSVSNGDDPSFVLSDVLEDGLGEIEVLLGRVAPSAIVVR